MAYDFIPNTPIEITNKIKDDIGFDISNVFIKLGEEYPSITHPIALNPSNPSSIKITRKLQDSLDIKSLKSTFPNLKLSFGEGSRGGRGVGNKGNLFESEFRSDILSWWNDNTSYILSSHIIEDLFKKYNIYSWKDLYVDAEGAKNNPRPLIIQNDHVLIHPGLCSIGDIVTDLTLRNTRNKSSNDVYLSLKYSSTVTFFNAGTKKYLPDNELQNGFIKNPKGIILISMFGLDNHLFCSVFNGSNNDTFPIVNTTHLINKELLEKLIQSGIGYGYHMIHKIKSDIISKEISYDYRNHVSSVHDVICYYGGKTGTGQRVDIEVFTPVYKLKFNFRNKQGGKYISHLMCDYSYL